MAKMNMPVYNCTARSGWSVPGAGLEEAVGRQKKGLRSNSLGAHLLVHWHTRVSGGVGGARLQLFFEKQALPKMQVLYLLAKTHKPGFGLSLSGRSCRDQWSACIAGPSRLVQFSLPHARLFSLKLIQSCTHYMLQLRKLSAP